MRGDQLFGRSWLKAVYLLLYAAFRSKCSVSSSMTCTGLSGSNRRRSFCATVLLPLAGWPDSTIKGMACTSSYHCYLLRR